MKTNKELLIEKQVKQAALSLSYVITLADLHGAENYKCEQLDLGVIVYGPTEELALQSGRIEAEALLMENYSLVQEIIKNK